MKSTIGSANSPAERRDWRGWIGGFVILAGAASLVLAPMPWRVAAACIAFGAIGGALFWTRVPLLAVLSIFFLFFAPDIARRIVPVWPTYHWQPMLVTGSGMMIVAYLSLLRVRRQGESARDLRT